MSNLDLLDKAFRDVFPAQGGDASIASVEYVSVEDLGNSKYGVVVRLVVWDVNEETGAQSIRDVKEQQITLKLPALDLATVARVRELVTGLVRVLDQCLAAGKVETLQTLMPYDLVKFDPIKLAKAKTADDFAKAYTAPSRLGRYLPNPA